MLVPRDRSLEHTCDSVIFLVGSQAVGGSMISSVTAVIHGVILIFSNLDHIHFSPCAIQPKGESGTWPVVVGVIRAAFSVLFEGLNVRESAHVSGRKIATLLKRKPPRAANSSLFSSSA